jgi:hypothetical protein
MLEKTQIRYYMSAHQITDFYGWKDEATKFIVILNHLGQLWLDSTTHNYNMTNTSGHGVTQ